MRLFCRHKVRILKIKDKKIFYFFLIFFGSLFFNAIGIDFFLFKSLLYICLHKYF
jgi:hypothetical protein